jgi:hypothetical protein
LGQSPKIFVAQNLQVDQAQPEAGHEHGEQPHQPEQSPQVVGSNLIFHAMSQGAHLKVKLVKTNRIESNRNASK